MLQHIMILSIRDIPENKLVVNLHNLQDYLTASGMLFKNLFAASQLLGDSLHKFTDFLSTFREVGDSRPRFEDGPAEGEHVQLERFDVHKNYPDLRRVKCTKRVLKNRIFCMYLRVKTFAIVSSLPP